eukprot:gene24334-biopygen4402
MLQHATKCGVVYLAQTQHVTTCHGMWRSAHHMSTTCHNRRCHATIHKLLQFVTTCLQAQVLPGMQVQCVQNLFCDKLFQDVTSCGLFVDHNLLQLVTRCGAQYCTDHNLPQDATRCDAKSMHKLQDVTSCCKMVPLVPRFGPPPGRGGHGHRILISCSRVHLTQGSSQ